ncbi:MAG: hypothetical protein ACU84Q_01225 [Gammaproteobacteria bacterium]
MSKIYPSEVLLQALIVCTSLPNSSVSAMTTDSGLECGELSRGLELKSHDGANGDAPLLRIFIGAMLILFGFVVMRRWRIA